MSLSFSNFLNNFLKIQKTWLMNSLEKVMKTIPFIIASKRIKYLESNLTKAVKGLYNGNYKMLWKEIREDITEWKHTSCLKTVRFNIIKMQSTSNSKNTSLKKIGRLTLSNFKIYYKATVLKIMQYWQKDRHIEQQNRDLRNQPSCI